MFIGFAGCSKSVKTDTFFAPYSNILKGQGEQNVSFLWYMVLVHPVLQVTGTST